MAEHLGTILLFIGGLVMFGLFVVFGTDIADPLLAKIGVNLNLKVDTIFAGI